MNIHEHLASLGYQGPVKDQFKDYAVYFHRRVPGTSHQWVVYEHKVDLPNGARYLGYTVDMVYESTDGIWVDSKFYGLSEEDLRAKLGDLEQRLYAAVKPMGGDVEDYRGKKE